MAFAANFSVTPNPLDPSSLSISDTSVGIDPNMTGRNIYPYKADGTLFLPAGNSLGYINWPLSGGSTLAITGLLDKDYCLLLLINWISSAPIGGSTYSKTSIATFTGYTNAFIYGLIQDISANPGVLNDKEYYDNLSIVQMEVDNSVQATAFTDQFSAQAALARAKYLMDNKAKNF